MKIKIVGIRPWVNESLCELVACESTCYDDCLDCMVRDANQPALEIRLKLSPADGSAEQKELQRRLESFLDSLNGNGKPAKAIQMALFRSGSG